LHEAPPQCARCGQKKGKGAQRGVSAAAKSAVQCSCLAVVPGWGHGLGQAPVSGSRVPWAAVPLCSSGGGADTGPRAGSSARHPAPALRAAGGSVGRGRGMRRSVGPTRLSIPHPCCCAGLGCTAASPLPEAEGEACAGSRIGGSGPRRAREKGRSGRSHRCLCLVSLCCTAWSQDAFLLGEAEGQRAPGRSLGGRKRVGVAPRGPLVSTDPRSERVVSQRTQEQWWCSRPRAPGRAGVTVRCVGPGVPARRAPLGGQRRAGVDVARCTRVCVCACVCKYIPAYTAYVSSQSCGVCPVPTEAALRTRSPHGANCPLRWRLRCPLVPVTSRGSWSSRADPVWKRSTPGTPELQRAAT